MTAETITNSITRDAKLLIWINTAALTLALAAVAYGYFQNASLAGFAACVGLAVGTLSHLLLGNYYRVRTESRINDSYEQLKENLSFDELTQVYNRRAGTERLHEEFERAKRSRESLSLALVDADNFKQINDTYGHQAGDHVLKSIASTIKGLVRAHDVVFRYGGEEFLIIMPATSEKESAVPLERLREELSGMTVAYGEHAIRISVSIGVSAVVGLTEDARDVISRADEALYRAKRSGKNRVVYHGFERFVNAQVAVAHR
jgi:diguanylate cyclase (GGDEF)-like protein